MDRPPGIPLFIVDTMDENRCLWSLAFSKSCNVVFDRVSPFAIWLNNHTVSKSKMPLLLLTSDMDDERLMINLPE